MQSNRAREAALDALASGEEIPSPELMDRAAKDAGTSTATVNTVIGNLVDEGEIERLGRGVKGDPYRYILSFNRRGARGKGKNETEATPRKSDHRRLTGSEAERVQRLIDEGTSLEAGAG